MLQSVNKKIVSVGGKKKMDLSWENGALLALKFTSGSGEARAIDSFYFSFLVQLSLRLYAIQKENYASAWSYLGLYNNNSNSRIVINSSFKKLFCAVDLIRRRFFHRNIFFFFTKILIVTLKIVSLIKISKMEKINKDFFLHIKCRVSRD